MTVVNSFSITPTKSHTPILTNKVPVDRSSPLIVLASSENNDNDAPNNSKGFLSSIPRPTVTQLISAWIVAISGNRLFQSIPSIIVAAGDNDVNLPSVAINGLMFSFGMYTLIKTVKGVDYDTLEDLETKSWAFQAGIRAVQGNIPTEFSSDNNIYQVATFAGGCFWGTELRFQRQVGVIATAVGYTQGTIEKPNYEQVCSGSTGHTEGIQLIYDPTQCSYQRLVTILLDSVDPTKLNQVGNDRGTQYRHGIYPHTEEQMTIAKEALDTRQSQYQQPIVTEVKEAAIFWPAENYHQRYLEKGGQSAEKDCEETVRCYG